MGKYQLFRSGGVAKTRTNVLFFRQPISWIIYTPTSFSTTQSKPHKTQQNPHFLPFTSKNLNIAPNIVKPPQKSTLSQTQHLNQNSQSKPLSSYINTKIIRKSTLLPIANFSPKITLISNLKREVYIGNKINSFIKELEE